MPAVYPALSVAVNTPASPASLPTPQPLPSWLKPYAACFKRLTKKTGYVFAQLDWLMEAWKVKRWKVYAIIDKLCAYGWFVRQRIPGSHDRIYWPVPIPERWPSPFQKAQQDVSAPQPERQRSWSEETAEKQEAVRLLVAQGVNAFRARRLAADRSLDEVKSSITAWSQWCQKADVKQPLRALEKAVRELWPPQADEVAAPTTVRVVAQPAPAPSAIEALEIPAHLKEIFLRRSGGVAHPPEENRTS